MCNKGIADSACCCDAKYTTQWRGSTMAIYQ